MSVDQVKPRPPRNYTPRSECMAAKARAAGMSVKTYLKWLREARERGQEPPFVPVRPPWEVEGCSRRHWYWKQAKARKAASPLVPIAPPPFVPTTPPWELEGISRAVWYRRARVAKGGKP